MLIKIRITWCTLYLLLLSFTGNTQKGIFISKGTSLTVLPGTVFSIDSLVLIPSAIFSLNGKNNELRNSFLLHSMPGQNINRVFHFAYPVTGFSGTLTIYYQKSELNSIPEDYLILNNYNGNKWQSFEEKVTYNNLANFVTTTGLTDITLNELTLARTGKILPVNLLSFTAQIIDQDVRLNWTTSSETNNAFFEIERSANGYNFDPIGRINGNGTTSLLHCYAFTDLKPLNRNNYYRLKQIDINHHLEYSSIIKISFNQIGIAIKVYPNPVTNTVIITSPGEVILQKPLARLFDTQGRLLETFPLVNELQNLNTSQLPAGSYEMIIDLKDREQIIRLIKK